MVALLPIAKGDLAGHDFHGNQYIPGIASADTQAAWIGGAAGNIRQSAARFLGDADRTVGYGATDSWIPAKPPDAEHMAQINQTIDNYTPHAVQMLRDVAAAPAYEGTLFRSINVPDKLYDRFGEVMKEGSTVDLPLVGFSQSSISASRFGTTHFVLDQPSHATTMPGSTHGEEEVLTGGRFHVDKVDVDPYTHDKHNPYAGWTIHLSQVDVFDPDDDGKLKKALRRGDFAPSGLDELFGQARKLPTMALPMIPLSKGEKDDHPFRGNQWTGGKPGPQKPDPEVERRSAAATNPEHARRAFAATQSDAPDSEKGNYAWVKQTKQWKLNAQEATESEYEGLHDVLVNGISPAPKVKQQINARITAGLTGRMKSDPELQTWARKEAKRLGYNNADVVSEGPLVLTGNTLMPAFSSQMSKWKADWMETVGHTFDIDAQFEANKAYNTALQKWMTDAGIDWKSNNITVIEDRMKEAQKNPDNVGYGSPTWSLARAMGVFETVSISDLKPGDRIDDGGSKLIGVKEVKGLTADGAHWTNLQLVDTDGHTSKWSHEQTFDRYKDKSVTTVEEAMAPVKAAIKEAGDMPTERPETDFYVPNVPFPKDVADVAIARRVRRTIDSWASSAGDSNPESIAMQVAAQRHFGLDPSVTTNLQTYATAQHISSIGDKNSPVHDLTADTTTVKAGGLLAGDTVRFSINVDAVVVSVRPYDKGRMATVKFEPGSGISTMNWEMDHEVEIVNKGEEPTNAWSLSQKLLDRDGAFYDRFVDQVYEQTQADLKAKGFDKLVFHRGAYWDPNDQTAPSWFRPPVTDYEATTKDVYLDEVKVGDDIPYRRQVPEGESSYEAATYATVLKIDKVDDPSVIAPEYTFHTTLGAVHVVDNEGMYRMTWEGFDPEKYHNDRNYPKIAVVDPGVGGTAYLDISSRDVDAGTNPLTSWSSAKEQAQKFASDYAEPGARGVMLTAVVPAERVWSLAASSGSGCLEEREAILIGPSFTTHMDYLPEMWGNPLPGANSTKYNVKNPSVWGIKTNDPPPVSMKLADLKPGDYIVHPIEGKVPIAEIDPDIGYLTYEDNEGGVYTYEPKTVLGKPTDLVMAWPKELLASGGKPASGASQEEWDAWVHDINAAAAKTVKKSAAPIDNIDAELDLMDWLKHLSRDVDSHGKTVTPSVTLRDPKAKSTRKSALSLLPVARF